MIDKSSRRGIVKIDEYFLITARKTNLLTEILAGVATYLSLAYIFIVNPAILSHAHMDPSMVLIATVFASGVTTLIMGIWARLPFAVAPGLEMNGFFAFYVVVTLGLSWQDALGTVFWSGVLYLIVALLPIRQKIVEAIPRGLKNNIGVSVGVFVATIGLNLAKIVVFKNGLPDLSAWTVSGLWTREADVLYVGLLISILLATRKFGFPGGMFVAIVISAVACKTLGIGRPVDLGVSTHPWSQIGQLHVRSSLTNPHFLPVTLTLFIINFFGDIGKFIGLTTAARTIQVDHKVPYMANAMYADAGGTILGSVLGTSNLITYVESAVGIATGGRTGITAIVCGVLMLLSVKLRPLVGLVPVEATAGVLVYVGWLLLPRGERRESSEPLAVEDGIAAVSMGLVSFVSFDLNMAMLIGFAIYTFAGLIREKRMNIWLTVATVALATADILQHVWVRH